MKMLDLFAGIGGFSLAASRVWDDHETVTFVEINKYCQQVLRKNFGQDINIVEDIRGYKPVCGTVDIITAGTPCQPASQAGKRLGKSDDRWLWGETFRVIREIRPTWFVLENVRGLLTLEQGMVFDELLSEMEAIGYEVQPFIIPAVSVNASHRRDRVWFIGRRNDAPYAGCEHGTRKTVEGKLKGADRQSDAAESERSIGCDGVRATSKNASDTESILSQRFDARQRKEQSWRGGWEQNWFQVATRFCRMDDDVPAELYKLETSDRTNRLKALGNSIVPAVAETIFRAIKYADEREK